MKISLSAGVATSNLFTVTFLLTRLASTFCGDVFPSSKSSWCVPWFFVLTTPSICPR